MPILESMLTQETPKKRFSDKFLLPEVSVVTPTTGELTNGLSYQVYVEDPYLLSLEPEVLDDIRRTEFEFSMRARENKKNGLWANEPAVVYDHDTKRNKRVFGDIGSNGTMSEFRDFLSSPGFLAWQGLLPSPQALEYLAGPEAYEDVIGKDGKLTPIDTNFSNWLKGCVDAQGIRSRASIMAWLIDAQITKTGIDNPKWISFACGTALPAFQTVAHINQGFSPDMRLMDIDRSALTRAEELHELFDVKGDINTVIANIFDPDVLGAEEADMVDAMGIFEYISPALLDMLKAKYGIDTSPEIFLSTCYRALKPGGKLIIGQMRKDRDYEDFTLGTIGWPYIHTRNPSGVEAIVSAAGIKDGSLSAYTASDGVYTVYSIDKPC